MKEFINKFAWCKKNQTYVAFIKVNSAPGKEEEQEKLMALLHKKSKNS